jgi:murein DD-endopeptidase MepM/ murein hydrolase activator NlpD
MPCALPPVDQTVAQLGWGEGIFLGPRGAGVRPVTHSGVDFMADAGSPVVAPWPGTVVAKGREDFGGSMGFARDAIGHYVVIAHGVVEARQNPVWTRYGHLRGESPLEVGARVEQGALVGYVGSSGLAPENRGRPRLFFQAFTNESLATRPRSLGSDPIDRFFRPLGVTREGGETPGMPITPYDHVPSWGGRLVQADACAATVAGIGLRGLDPRRIQSKYDRFGRTQLSSTARYAPAVYDVPASGGGGGLVLALALGAGAWWFSRR